MRIGRGKYVYINFLFSKEYTKMFRKKMFLTGLMVSISLALAFNAYAVTEPSNPSFEEGSFTGWTKTGTAWGNNPVSTDLYTGGGLGEYWAYSLGNGESATGTLTSDDFTLVGNSVYF